MRGNKRGIICLFVIDIKTKTKKIQHLWSTDPFSLQPVHAFFFSRNNRISFVHSFFEVVSNRSFDRF